MVVVFAPGTQKPLLWYTVWPSWELLHHILAGTGCCSQHPCSLILPAFHRACALCAEPRGPHPPGCSPLVAASHCSTSLPIWNEELCARHEARWEGPGMRIPWCQGAAGGRQAAEKARQQLPEVFVEWGGRELGFPHSSQAPGTMKILPKVVGVKSGPRRQICGKPQSRVQGNQCPDGGCLCRGGVGKSTSVK